MLRINKELDRCSGGKIPAGSILDYTINTVPNSEMVEVQWRLYYSEEALKTAKMQVPPTDIKAFQMKGDSQVKSISGAKYTPDPKLLEGIKPLTLTNIGDTIMKTLLEEQFLGEGSCEIIGIIV